MLHYIAIAVVCYALGAWTWPMVVSWMKKQVAP